MAWNGGDDDGFGATQGPWGSKPRQQGGGGGGKRGGGGQPPGPDIDELIRRGQEQFRGMIPGGGWGFTILGVFLLVVWLGLGGIYRVDPDEQAAVLRLGKFHRLTGPGLHYHIPEPFEEVIKRPVTRINREEIGFRTASTSRGNVQRSVAEESLMLTGDENIVDVHFEVQWKIKDLKNYLFNIRNPQIAVKNAAESAMREVIGENPIAKALAQGRLEIEIQSKKLLQDILNSYDAGIEIVRLQMLAAEVPAPVIDAFRDVQSAKADQERLVNEAESYRNDILPKARGQAEQVLQEAEAYKQQVIAESSGEAQRFMSVYKEYKNARDVTRKRMYLETLEEILSGMDKVVVDSHGGVVPYLPLPDVQKRQTSVQP